MPRVASPVDVALADLARVLDRLGVGWYLFGAQAAIVYGSTRVTEDIDVTIALGTHTTRELMTALTRRHFALRVSDSAGFVEKTRVLPVVHRTTAMPVDIVLAGPGLEELFLERSTRHQRGRISVPIASPEDLIVMKILAGRPRDHDDVRAVLRVCGPLLDARRLRATLTMLEDALGQSDLRPVLTRLRSEARRAPASRARAARRATMPGRKG